jgi:hypothetical protein
VIGLRRTSCKNTLHFRYIQYIATQHSHSTRTISLDPSRRTFWLGVLDQGDLVIELLLRQTRHLTLTKEIPKNG